MACILRFAALAGGLLLAAALVTDQSSAAYFADYDILTHPMLQ